MGSNLIVDSGTFCDCFLLSYASDLLCPSVVSIDLSIHPSIRPVLPTPSICPSICPFIYPSIHLSVCQFVFFFLLLGVYRWFLHNCSGPNSLSIMFITTPAQLHTIFVAAYSALFFFVFLLKKLIQMLAQLSKMSMKSFFAY